MWHVSSRSGVATLQTAIHLLLTYLQVKFFHGVEPVELIRHRAKFSRVQQQLSDMCHRRPVEAATGRHRQMECCLMSYSTPCGKGYQIFDTELSLA